MGKDSTTSHIRVEQIRSTAGIPDQQIRILRGLGLRRVGHNRVHRDNNCIRGMINKVIHLVNYKLVDGAEK